MPASPPSLRIRLVRSPIGNTIRQKATVRALGLRRIHQVVNQPDNPAVRGMIFKVQHLVVVDPQPATDEPATDAPAPPSPPSAVDGPPPEDGDEDEEESRENA